jgi:hypothetical protein
LGLQIVPPPAFPGCQRRPNPNHVRCQLVYDDEVPARQPLYLNDLMTFTRMRRAAARLVLTGCALMLFAAPARAQEPPSKPPAPAPVRVFIDCQSASCDYEYFKTEIAFVDHVRDRKDADVHVLITGQTTGSGGQEYSLKFIGLGRFQSVDAAMIYAASVDATSDQIRQALVQHLTLGLVRYAAESPAGPRLTVKYTPETAKAGGQGRQAGRDPWDFWVFRISGNGYFNGEESTSSESFYASASANRTTEAWKIDISFSGNYYSSAYDLGDGETFTSTTKSYSGSGRVVKSLGPHWAAAVSGRASRSTYSNQDLAVGGGGGVEYDLFPYAESTRRQLRFQWTAALTAYDYAEETVYGKMGETVPTHSAVVSLDLRQPWGQVSTMVDFTQALTDFSQYRLGAYGGIDVRLFKGFSLELYGDYSRVRDQRNLPKAGASDQEILVRMKELATGFRYYFNVGISYSFGSIFNNVVNPRFGR